ncbi:MAG: HEAT repeat domain-containing protein, partial [Proteobacteria bacterium]|nr:HEAT repeat domain-containing protein [Pseudomonadota bacterium]
GNYLENEVLQQGVIWGIGRIAGVKPHLMRDSFVFLIPSLDSCDAMLRGLSAWAIGAIDPVRAQSVLLHLKNDDSVIKIYSDGNINRFTIKNIVDKILHELIDV